MLVYISSPARLLSPIFRIIVLKLDRLTSGIFESRSGELNNIPSNFSLRIEWVSISFVPLLPTRVEEIYLNVFWRQHFRHDGPYSSATMFLPSQQEQPSRLRQGESLPLRLAVSPCGRSRGRPARHFNTWCSQLITKFVALANHDTTGRRIQEESQESNFDWVGQSFESSDAHCGLQTCCFWKSLKCAFLTNCAMMRHHAVVFEEGASFYGSSEERYQKLYDAENSGYQW